MTRSDIPKSVLITDVDNTLYDWVNLWYASFGAAVSVLETETGLSRELLYPEIRASFQRHHTSEYEYFVQELPTLQSMFSRDRLRELNDATISASHRALDRIEILYPGVETTLRRLKEIGCLIIAYTESMELYTIRRIVKSGLNGILDILYCRANAIADLSSTTDSLILYGTAIRYEEELKPNPRVLLDMLQGVDADRLNCVYVGDSLMKDIAMAQDAGVDDVYAQYGISQYRREYELLRLVTHWTDEDVEREKGIYQRGEVTPTYILKTSFSELTSLFDFQRYTSNR